MTRGEMCRESKHRHFHDPAPPFNLRCIECEDAWLDGLADWLKQYKRRTKPSAGWRQRAREKAMAT